MFQDTLPVGVTLSFTIFACNHGLTIHHSHKQNTRPRYPIDTGKRRQRNTKQYKTKKNMLECVTDSWTTSLKRDFSIA